MNIHATLEGSCCRAFHLASSIRSSFAAETYNDFCPFCVFFSPRSNQHLTALITFSDRELMSRDASSCRNRIEGYEGEKIAGNCGHID